MRSERRIVLSRRRFLTAGIVACGCCTAAGAALFSESLPVQPPPSSITYQPDVKAPTAALPPILVVTDASRPFGPYASALLKADGLVGHRCVSLAELTPGLLRGAGVVLLLSAALGDGQPALLRDYVEGGGGLIAIRPSADLAALMGVRFLGSVTRSGELLATPHTATRGVSRLSLQFHGDADDIALDGAQALAVLADADRHSSPQPLVTLRRVGSGWAAMWAFDLPQSIALTRQGDPGAVGQDRDPIPGVRTIDAFVGWADLDRVALPQADELQRMLSAMVEFVGAERGPLPRLWYFPHQQRGVLVATGDAHGMPAAVVDRGLRIMERYDATMSVYYSTTRASVLRRAVRRMQWSLQGLPVVGWAFTETSGYPTPSDVASWRARGHGFGLHPYVEEGVQQGYEHFYSDFVRLGYGEPDLSVRTHRVLWSGWAETAKVQARYGLRMNLDFYHAGLLLHASDGRVMAGYLSGSGLPAPLVDLDGTLLNIYQQHTHLVDEHLMPLYAAGTDMGLDSDEALTVSRRLIDQALQENPTAIGMQWHLDPLSFGGRSEQMSDSWINGTLAHARGAGLPVISAERWQRFTHARAETRIVEQRWDAELGQLRLSVEVPAGSEDPIELLLPAAHAQRGLAHVRVNGAPASTAERVVALRRYVAVSIPAGAVSVEALYPGA